MIKNMLDHWNHFSSKKDKIKRKCTKRKKKASLSYLETANKTLFAAHSQPYSKSFKKAIWQIPNELDHYIDWVFLLLLIKNKNEEKTKWERVGFHILSKEKDVLTIRCLLFYTSQSIGLEIKDLKKDKILLDINTHEKESSYGLPLKEKQTLKITVTDFQSKKHSTIIEIKKANNF